VLFLPIHVALTVPLSTLPILSQLEASLALTPLCLITHSQGGAGFSDDGSTDETQWKFFRMTSVSSDLGFSLNKKALKY